MKQITSNTKCLAIGQIELDKLKDLEISLQKAVFIQQITISEEMAMPVILHCVRTWNELKQFDT